MKSTAAGQEKEPRRIALRIRLDEEDFKLLEEDARDSERNRTWHAEVLLKHAIRASWAYGGRHRDVPAVASARNFFSGLRDLQAVALEEIQRAGYAAGNAAREAAIRCQRWLDAEKVHRADGAAGSKVIDGKFRPALKGSTS